MSISLRWVRPGAAALLAASAALPDVPVLGCPLCRSETGQLVRAGIFDGDFAVNLLVTALPFAIFTLIVACLHAGFPAARRADSGGPPRSRPRSPGSSERVGPGEVAR